MITSYCFRKLIISIPLLVAFLNAQALTGKVVDSETGDPLVGAQVFVKEHLLVQQQMLVDLTFLMLKAMSLF